MLQVTSTQLFTKRKERMTSESKVLPEPAKVEEAEEEKKGEEEAEEENEAEDVPPKERRVVDLQNQIVFQEGNDTR